MGFTDHENVPYRGEPHVNEKKYPRRPRKPTPLVDRIMAIIIILFVTYLIGKWYVDTHSMFVLPFLLICLLTLTIIIWAFIDYINSKKKYH